MIGPFLILPRINILRLFGYPALFMFSIRVVLSQEQRSFPLLVNEGYQTFRSAHVV